MKKKTITQDDLVIISSHFVEPTISNRDCQYRLSLSKNDRLEVLVVEDRDHKDLGLTKVLHLIINGEKISLENIDIDSPYILENLQEAVQSLFEAR